ncbi:PxORF106 peptide [Plutella xylostella granulovirus]|jgi:hypothetical protein|uniref:ORF104 protein n=1 Tax=Plutella xylostella granulovirus TaxID=98383 RepID=Q9DVS7_9BBAC|nr:PxORF106 peptide [Plutella xylostella granulovirus]AAG27404.1 PxORF106 peptide [Plutella xylostella granulovirus]AMQ35716.1 PxGV-Corf104 protein [Plutella xylostella granulovirus]AMQ35833.1 PxGV-Korf104 protein [Plutella xylostella granulovirus]AMQ35950.1 PxGV-Morf104 protein [Plutella xylostella granulovirus]AMQ36067.1 PxGV-Torf104 protein [Plutella xylostella granulovirus]
MADKLTGYQCGLSDKYCLENYASRLTAAHRNTKQEIYELEKATRGQSKNNLWKLLRINRKTASKSTYFSGDTEAMRYGIEHEDLIKKNCIVMDVLCAEIENKLNASVRERVLECGLFLTELGLFSASPDGYFVLDDGRLVTMEIKCPFTYKDSSLEQIISGFNNRSRYRIPNTAFSVNKTGPVDIRVEKLNEHYRQMQWQMYVTGAIMAVYLVMIGDTPHVYFVDRDEKLTKEIGERELNEFNRIVSDNNKKKYLLMEVNRLKTFDSASTDSKLLAKNGFYQWYGQIICYFCNLKYELDMGVAAILDNHKLCDKTNNVKLISIAHPSYIKLQKRIDSITSTGDRVELAQRGFFEQNGVLSLFCCGGAVHNQDCRYEEM